jgi:hypothetical protein
MPSTITDPALDEPTLVVVPWHDDVVDPIGYDPRSPYVEMFWLNILGPTATWLLRRVVDGLDHYPGGYELDLEQTAKALGLGYSRGTLNPFARALHRCVLFGAAQPVDGGLAVRRRLPPVSARHLARMPDHLRDAHRSWLRAATSPEAEVARARILAAAMVAAGDPLDSLERQLLGLGVLPAVATDVAVELMAEIVSRAPETSLA